MDSIQKKTLSSIWGLPPSLSPALFRILSEGPCFRCKCYLEAVKFLSSLFLSSAQNKFSTLLAKEEMADYFRLLRSDAAEDAVVAELSTLAGMLEHGARVYGRTVTTEEEAVAFLIHVASSAQTVNRRIWFEYCMENCCELHHPYSLSTVLCSAVSRLSFTGWSESVRRLLLLLTDSWRRTSFALTFYPMSKFCLQCSRDSNVLVKDELYHFLFICPYNCQLREEIATRISLYDVSDKLPDFSLEFLLICLGNEGKFEILADVLPRFFVSRERQWASVGEKVPLI
jgi:hypothetical protein